MINRSSFKCARARWRVRDCIRNGRFLTRAMTTRFALLCGFALCGISSAFVGPKPRASLRRAPVRAMVNIPRISLPDQVSEIIKQQDLKSPNELSDSEYNTYSAAAIQSTCRDPNQLGSDCCRSSAAAKGRRRQPSPGGYDGASRPHA